jgi:L-threonine-O-3-phosphate decarboxylase
VNTMAARYARSSQSPSGETDEVVHGALDYAELERLGLDPDNVLDFSANINPYGPADAVREAVSDVPLDRYPDRHCLALRRALEDFLGVPRDNILSGNGASELIWLVALAFLQAGDRVLVLGPTYCEYARAARLMGARVTVIEARKEDGFVLNQTAVVNQLKTLRPRLAFVCNPNNPTGTVIAAETIADWARRFRQTIFVVDEAYLPFVANGDSVITCSAWNILVLRSMTKDCCLAGLRLGYAAGAARLIEKLRQAQPPWSVSAVAQAAGVAALRHPAHLEDSLKRLASAKHELFEGLTQLGLVPVPSTTHFFLVPCGGSALRQVLLLRGILVRDCASFGVPNFVRIATRRPEDNSRLLAALREVL